MNLRKIYPTLLNHILRTEIKSVRSPIRPGLPSCITVSNLLKHYCMLRF